MKINLPHNFSLSNSYLLQVKKIYFPYFREIYKEIMYFCSTLSQNDEKIFILKKKNLIKCRPIDGDPNILQKKEKMLLREYQLSELEDRDNFIASINNYKNI